MYEQERGFGGRRDARRSGGGTGQRRSRSAVSRQERVRLGQLLVCLVLFLAVFVGKGVSPTKLVQLRGDLSALIAADTDFRAAFSRLGESLSGKGEVLDELGGFCAEVFGAEEPGAELPAQAVPQLTGLLQQEQQFLGRDRDLRALTDHYLPAEGARLALETAPKRENLPEAALSGPAPGDMAALGTVLLQSDYDGEPLPERYTMDQLSLGGLDTATPVLGRVTSVYGYRDHPIDGRHQFHGGVDLSGGEGDPIRAFAAGRVEYVGEDDSYGLYFQLDHGNGIKSFYAHCRDVCVKKGQRVALGERVGEVGSSGAATGPHLHLELKYNGTHLNPVYYIETLSAK